MCTLEKSKCPDTHPFAYYNGQYCCSVGYETIYAPHGVRCDGGSISLSSSCCGGTKVTCPREDCGIRGI